MVSKYFLKSILSMVCVFTLAIGSVCSVSADYNDVMFDLSSLNVLKDLEINEDLNANITRAEFSQLVVNLLGYNNVAYSFDDLGVFKDISDSKYKGAINLLYDLNIISGTGKNIFSPDLSLTYQQVGKFMVNILGYSKIVKNGDLSSYYMLAGSIGVYSNVDTTKPFVTWYDAFVIAHNAMDIDLMTKDFGMIGDNYLIQEGKTLRTSLSTTTGRNVKKLKGIVTADRTTYLLEPRSSMKATQVEVNGKLYKCNFIVPDGLVGMEVNFYVDYTEDSNGIVTSIAPSTKNFVVEFNLDDLGSVLPDKIEYLVNDSKKVPVKVNDYAKFIYNGRWDMKASFTDIADCKNGYVKLVDNNEDEVIDIVFVYEFSDAIVERVYEETKQIYFANNQLLYGSRYISFNEDEDKTIVKLFDASGNPVAFENIEENNIISIAKSKDGQVVNAVISKKIVTGVVNEIDDYSVVIDSDVFDYVVKPDVKLGTHVDAYFNFMNKVFYVEKTKTENTYAYVFDAKLKSGISGTVNVALIMPGYISETSKESFDNEGTAGSTKELFFRNNSKVLYELASKVKIDDKTVKATNAVSMIKDKIVSYSLDANNKINKFIILDVFNSDLADRKYNQNGKTFSSGNKNTEGFGITESVTMSICIPTNEDASDDDLLVPVKLVHGSPYSINAYDVDEISNIAGLAVIKAEMRSGVAGSISPKTSDIAILIKVSNVLDENGNDVIRVNMLTKEGEKSYTVSPLMSSTVHNRFMSMKKGDIFFYETIEGTVELRNCQLLQAEDNYDVTGVYNEGQINEICVGKVVDCRYNYVSAQYNRWTDCVTVDCGNKLVNYEIFKTGTPVIFIVDESGNAKLGKFEDIQCGNTIYVGSVYSNVRVLAVRK